MEKSRLTWRVKTAILRECEAAMAASDVHLALRHSFAVTQRTFQRHMTELVRDGFLICLDPHKSSNHRFRRVGSTWPEFKRQRDAWMEANSQ